MRKSLFAFALTLALLLVSVGIKAQTDVYLSEDFTGWSSSGVGSSWNRSDNNPSTMGTSYQWKGSTAGYSGACAYSYMYGTSALKARLKSPSFQLPQGNDAIVKFMMKGNTDDSKCGVLNIYISTDDGATYESNVIASNVVPTGTWKEYAFVISGYSGQVKLVLEAVGAGTNNYRYIYIDNLVVKKAPTCKAPIDPSISNLSGSGATLYWNLDTMGVTPDQYSVTLRDTADNVVYYNPAVYMSGFAFTGLQAGTTYTAYVRSNCDVQSYQGFSDSVSVQFTTLAPAINPPLFEHFDTWTAATFPPAGYYVHNATLNTTSGLSHSTKNSVKLTTTSTDNAYIIFPLMNIDADNVEMDFWLKRSTTTNPLKFKVGYLTDPSDIMTMTEVIADSITSGTTWYNFRFNTASVQDKTNPVMLCVYIDAAYSISAYLDDVDIHVIPSCTRPENLTCSNVTDSSVTLSWTMANASSILVKAMSLPDSVVTTQLATASPYTFTGLTQNTQYVFTVQGVCSASDSSQVSVAATAKTSCSVADSTLFFEGAEGTTGSALPDCWTTGYMVNTSTSTANPFQTSTTQKVGTRSFSIPLKAVGTISYLCSQARNFDQSGKYSFRYKMYRPTGTSYNGEVLKIFVTPTPGDTTNAVEVIPAINFSAGNAPTTTTIGWNDYEGVINYQGVGYVMAVMYCKNGVQRYIDNLEVFLTPSCPKVSGITKGAVGTNSFDFSWTRGLNESQWVVDYTITQGASVIIDTTVVVDTTNFAIQNLTPATAYTVAGTVRSLCGAGDTAEAVSFSFPITTECEVITTLPYTEDFEGATFPPICWSQALLSSTGTKQIISSTTNPHSGTKCANAQDQTAGSLPALTTPKFAFDGSKEYQMIIWVYRQSTSYQSKVDEALHFYLTPTPNDTTNAVEFGTAIDKDYRNAPVEAAVGYYQYTMDLPANTNGDYAVMVVYHNQFGAGTYFDDITIREKPNCLDIDGSAVVSDIDTVSAKITLSDTSALSGWSYVYGISGTPVAEMTAVDTTGSFIVLTGLTPATKYDIYVRRHCGEGEYSPWSAVVTATTLAIPANAPYSCGFEDAAENANWQFANTPTVDGNKFAIGTVATAAYAGIYGIYVSPDAGVTHAYTINKTSVSYAYRTINFQAKGYQITYRWKATGGESTAPYDFGRVMLVPASSTITGGTGCAFSSATFPAGAIFLDPEGVTYLNKHTSDGTDWNFVSVDVNMTAQPGLYNLALYWNNDGLSGEGLPLAVDDISITELSCIPPVTITPALTDTSATLTVSQASASQWEFIVDTVAFTKDDVPAAPLARINSTDGTATVTGLTPNTDYWYSVRTICGQGDTSAWLSTASLRTYCAAYPTPYNEGFETVASANCWSVLANSSGNPSVARATDKKNSGLASLKAVNANVISPEFAVDSLAHYMISGWAYSTKDSAQITVGVIVDPNNSGTYIDLSTVIIPVKNTWTEFTAYFTALLDPDYALFKNAKYIAIDCGGDNTVYFDDILVDLTPTCPKPNEVTISNITANSFDISFTDNASASQWVVYTNGTPHVISSTTATVSGLNAHTAYTVSLVAVCSATDTSAVTDCGSVTTECDVMSLPYTESFETLPTTYTQGMISNLCWSELGTSATAAVPYYKGNANTPSDGARNLWMSSNSTKQPMYLIFPQLASTTNALKVSFDVKFENATSSGNVYFGYMTDVTADSSFVLLETASRSLGTAAWTTMNVVVPSIPSGARFAFKYADVQSTVAYYAYVDNLQVAEIRNCSDPETPTVSNVTSATAHVAFTDTAAAHTAWEYVYGPANFDPNTATPVSLDTTVFTISGLTDDTNYDVYVRAVCGVGDESNYVKASFRTLCLPFYVTATTPFSEDFNSYDYGQYMNSGTCYTLLNEPANNSYWAKAYPLTEPSATATTYYFYGHSADRFDKSLYWYILKSQFTNGSVVRQFHLDGGQTYEVSAWVRNSTTVSYQSKVSAMVGQTTTTLDTITSLVVDGATTTSRSIEGHTTYPYNELYQQIKFFVTPDSTGDYFIGYNVAINNASTGTYLYFDDWTVKTFEGCSPAIPVVDSVTAHEAYISIEDSTFYQFEYVLNDTTLTPTVIDTTHFVLTGLNTATAYTIYLRKYCEASLHSEWFSASFRTDCGPIDNLPYTNDFEDEPTGTSAPFITCWSRINDASGTVNYYPYNYSLASYAHSGTKSLYFSTSTTTTYAEHQMAILPEVDTTVYPINTLRLKFWAKRSATASYADAPMIIGVMSDPTDITTFVPVETVLVSNTAHQQFKASLARYTGNGTYIAIRLDRQSTTCYCYLDDVTLEEIPACEGPEVAPTFISSTMTTLTVRADMAGKDTIEFGLAPTTGVISPVAIDTTILSVDGDACFTGLTGSTNYAVWYRHLCGIYGASAWSTAYAVGTTTASDCFAPQNLHTVGIINDHHVAITWGKAPDAVGYQYELKQGSTVVDSAVNLNDTIVYDSLTMNTAYTFRVRTFCATDTSAWQTISFQTTYLTYTIPFVCDFENPAVNTGWRFRTLSSTAPNQFAIGSGVSAAGSNALYVSNDGSTYAYTNGSASVSDAEILLEIPAGNYYVSYDWQAKGEGNYDFGRFFLVPSSVTVSGTTYSSFSSSLPTGAISLEPNKAKINLVDDWTNYANVVTVPNTNLYKLVAVWANDGSGGTQPPLAVDNILIEEITCMPVNSVSMISINPTDAKALVTPYDSAAVEYAFSTFDSEDSVSTWTAAAGDTISLTSLLPGTRYYLFVRHACSATDKSRAKRTTFLTPVNPVSLPFVATFETNDTTNSHWTMTSGNSLNWFVIGSANSSQGSRSLYITDDGSSNHYSSQTGTTNYAYAYIPVTLPAASINVSYDWICHGESSADYGHVFLAPTTMVPQDNVMMAGMSGTAVPTGTISLDGAYAKLNSTDSLNYVWFNVDTELQIEEAGTYNLVVSWRNDYSVNHQPPMTIDNIRITEITCPVPKISNIYIDSASTDMLRVKVLGAKPGASIIYHLASDASFSDTVAIGETAPGDSLFTATGLAASTWYYARARFNCGGGDSSAVYVFRVRTSCGVNQLPYSEDFESFVANSTERTQLTQNCWSVLAHNAAATPTTANAPYYYITTTASSVHGGSKALYIYNYSATGNYQTFAMPRVDSLAGASLSLWYKNGSTTSTYAKLKVGYLSNPDSLESFVMLQTYPLTTTYTKVEYDYPATVPANARPAILADGIYSMYIDDIRLSRIVPGATYYETLCYGSGYTKHGLNCAPNSLAPGDTTLTTILRSNLPGTADSIVTVNLHILSQIINNIDDTICSGVPYNRGLFNIANPETKNYFRTFTSALGCDSTVNLNLYVVPSTETLHDTICQGDAYQFYGQTLTQTGSYVVDTINAFGCRDTITLHLFVVDSATYTTATICNGSSYVFEGQTFTTAGIHVVPVVGPRGCVINKTLNLSVIQSDTTLTVSFCTGGSVFVADTTINTPGYYERTKFFGTDPHDPQIGCYMTYHITATQDSIIEGHVYDYACENHTYSGYGISGLVVTKDTVVDVRTRTLDAQCDSLSHVHLTFKATTHTANTAQIVQGDVYHWNGEDLTEEGTYTRTYQSVEGCDSVVTLTLSYKGSGVDNVSDVHMTIVPNPVNAGATTFVYGEFGEVENVEILNNFGQVIDRFTPQSYPIEVSGISASGLYYVRVTTKSGNVHLQKLIVK